MLTSTFAHDELFDETLGRPLFILPAIEGGAKTPASPAFEFSKEFPPDNVGRSKLVIQIKDLITRYLDAPRNRRWPERWLRLYDQNGASRLAIHIIQVRSEKVGPDEHATFARGFDAVADHVRRETDVLIGFTIDALLRPVINGVTGLTHVYYPTAREAGPHLKGQASLLAIQGFIPEISLSAERQEWERRDLKRQYLADWMAQGVPVLMDLTPGYDGHLVFPPPPHGRSGIYGNNGWWRRELLALLPDRFTGVVFNTWNGYTEGYAAVPTTEHGEANFRCLQRVFRKWFDIYPVIRTLPRTEVTALWRQPGQHLDLFMTGTDGAVWTIWWEPVREWGYWSQVPDALRSVRMQPRATVTAVWREAGKHLDLFVTGTDGAVWSIWWNDTVGWRPEWLLIHPEIKMQPGATVTAVWREAGKHLDLFVTGTDGSRVEHLVERHGRVAS